MSRIARKDLQTSFLHIMVQGINKEFIFSKREYIETYLQLINKYQNKFPVSIIAYCVMNNHAHMLVYVKDIKMLGRFMHIINLQYSQYYNKLNNRCGVIFRNKYRIEPIYNMKHLVNCINYIHLNPVKAEIVGECWQYPYSSYKDYQNNSGICKNEIMCQIFGKNYNFYELINQAVNYYFIDTNMPSIKELYMNMDKRITGILKSKSL